jgi:glutathione synthase/RimK-type ligase-like ATP-grasp enzyme
MKMIIGIHPDRIGKESYSDKWSEFLRARGANVRTLDLLAPNALRQASQCAGIMWRWAHNPRDKQSAQRILHTIEHSLGIPVYPDTRTAWHYDEKVAQFHLLQALQAPMPRTWLFWSRDEAMTWAQAAPYPVVFKLSVGAGSSNVAKVETEAEAVALINRVFTRGIFPYTMNEYRLPSGFPRSLGQAKAMVRRLKDALRYVWQANYPTLHPVFWRPEYGYAYFQEFLPGNSFDTRVSVIGDRAFGFRRFNRPGDYRASGSGRIDYDPESIDCGCVEIAFQISRLGSFQSMAYDFIYRRKQPVLCEISYAYADSAVHDCPGRWDSNLNWIDGQMWPEEAQVEDFLARVQAAKGVI